MKPMNIPSEKLFKVLMRYKYLLLVLAAGLLLILWPTGGEDNKNADEAAYAGFSVEEMEKRLEAALGAMDGAGRVSVTLTLKTDMQVIVQEDVNSQSSRRTEGGTVTGYDTSSQSKTVLINDGSAQQPIVTKRIYPEYEGAVIVCDGGADSAVRLAVSEAVAALTGLGSDKITILKMKK